MLESNFSLYSFRLCYNWVKAYDIKVDKMNVASQKLGSSSYVNIQKNIYICFLGCLWSPYFWCYYYLLFVLSLYFWTCEKNYIHCQLWVFFSSYVCWTSLLFIGFFPSLSIWDLNFIGGLQGDPSCHSDQFSL
jgi:hypothetical protein